jgi:xanthine dehydrogenase accessory factor
LNERIFQTLAHWLAEVPVVLVTVLETRGATPRKGGSRMLIGPGRSAFSVGGGLAEATVIEAARSLLDAAIESGEVAIDLSGKPGAAGICGGVMRIALRTWSGTQQRQRAQQIADHLAAGQRVALLRTEYGGSDDQQLAPNPRLLIVGGGHCAAALCDLVGFLDYEVWVHDDRREFLDSPSFARARRLNGKADALRQAFDTQRAVSVVLLNRDFTSDVAALRAIKGLPTHFIGMMGSRKRIGTVFAALPDQPDLATRVQAPVGLDIDAETPHEIAISILAQLIQHRTLTAL